jgi:endonuclease-3
MSARKSSTAKAGKSASVKKPARVPTASSRPYADIPIDLPTVTPAEKKRARQLADALAAEYPDAHCELDYSTPHELLVATILSAQTTDVGVNKATPALFKRFPTPADYAKAAPADIEPYIKTLGFFRMKARAVHEAMKEVHERFGDRVPQTMDELLTLRGVARKTANVVLGNAFRKNMGFVVDTHIDRLSKRFGLAPHDANVASVEKRLMALFPRERWCDLSHQIIWHGRRVCKARPTGGKCADHAICRTFGESCELRAVSKAKGAAKKPRD